MDICVTWMFVCRGCLCVVDICVSWMFVCCGCWCVVNVCVFVPQAPLRHTEFLFVDVKTLCDVNCSCCL